MSGLYRDQTLPESFPDSSPYQLMPTLSARTPKIQSTLRAMYWAHEVSQVISHDRKVPCSKPQLYICSPVIVKAVYSGLWRSVSTSHARGRSMSSAGKSISAMSSRSPFWYVVQFIRVRKWVRKSRHNMWSISLDFCVEGERLCYRCGLYVITWFRGNKGQVTWKQSLLQNESGVFPSYGAWVSSSSRGVLVNNEDPSTDAFFFQSTACGLTMVASWPPPPFPEQNTIRFRGRSRFPSMFFLIFWTSSLRFIWSTPLQRPEHTKQLCGENWTNCCSAWMIWKNAWCTFPVKAYIRSSTTNTTVACLQWQDRGSKQSKVFLAYFEW